MKPQATTAKADTAEQGRPIGTVRIGRVSYDHHPIHQAATGNGTTLGQIIDKHLVGIFRDGGLINEVSLIFETPEDQHRIRDCYLPLVRRLD